MTIQHIPSKGKQSLRERFRYWRPRGSRLVFFVVNDVTKRPYSLLRWGGEMYLPVDKGDRPVVYIHNGFGNMWIAAPTFLEGANVYKGGPSEPDLCTPNSMWEAEPGGYIQIKGIHDPKTKQTRPIIIERYGDGMTIAEAMYQDANLRGQWAFYERWQAGYGTPPNRSWNEGWSDDYPPIHPYYWGSQHYRRDAQINYDPNDFLGAFRGGESRGGFEGVSKGGPTLGGDMMRSPVSYGPTESTGRAGTGLGAAEQQPSFETGMTYNRFSAKFLLLHLEFRHDLAKLFSWSAEPDYWFWDMPDLHVPWWESIPWSYDPTGGIAPDVPVSGPHRPR